MAAILLGFFLVEALLEIFNNWRDTFQVPKYIIISTQTF